jgi:hypothetical protein
MFRLTLSKTKLKQTAKHEKEALKIKATSLFKKPKGPTKKKALQHAICELFFELLMNYLSHWIQE